MAKKNKMITQRALVKTGDSTFDRIFAHLINEDKYPLTPAQNQIYERWLLVWTMRTNSMSTEQTIKLHMKRSGVSRGQAYNDLNRAERLFGNLAKTSRDGKRAVWAEYVHQYLLLCLEDGDLKATGKALDLLERAYDLDKEESSTFNPEKLENKEVVLKIDKTTRELILATLKSGVVDLNTPETIDVDHETLN